MHLSFILKCKLLRAGAMLYLYLHCLILCFNKYLKELTRNWPAMWSWARNLTTYRLQYHHLTSNLIPSLGHCEPLEPNPSKQISFPGTEDILKRNQEDPSRKDLTEKDFRKEIFIYVGAGFRDQKEETSVQDVWYHESSSMPTHKVIRRRNSFREA